MAIVVLIPFHPVSDAGIYRGVRGVPARIQPTGFAGAGSGSVWLVESTAAYETYSNGLRVEKRFGKAGPPRSWRPLPLGGGPAAAPRSTPAGIVFHATESEQLPFDPGYNHRLKVIGEELLDYIRNRHAYNFVIDRFGRVYGVVPEDQVAFHAGHSVWADRQWVYLNLNDSFLGVSFEARTADEPEPLSPAQIRAGRMLTEMLIAKYGISADNCVTHAQVSVNPANMRMGWHTDWMEDFPYNELGLRDNYALPLPALYLFGFSPDGSYSSGNAVLRRALAESEARLRDRAAERGAGLPAYRQILRRNYQKALAMAGAKKVEGVNQ